MLVDRRKFIKCSILCVVLLLYIVLIISHRNDTFSNAWIRIICFSSLIIYIIEIWQIYTITGHIFTPTNLFLLAFYVFQNGQLLLLALGIDFNSFYINSLKQYTMPVVVYTSISNVIAGLVAPLTALPENSFENNHRVRKIDAVSQDTIQYLAKLEFIITGLVSIPLIMIKLSYGLSGGYSSVRSFENTLPSIVDFIEYMFMPFGVLYMAYSEKEESKWARNIIVIWAIVTALCGDRTTGIGAIVVIVYLAYLQSGRSKENIGKKYYLFSD